MKSNIIFAICFLYSFLIYAQVNVIDGPELDNDKKSTMNRLIPANVNNYYCYRVRSKGKGTSHFVEKYDSKKMALVFSKEINIEKDDAEYKIIEVLYSNDNIYVFRKHYDKIAGEMQLTYQMVSSEGNVEKNLISLVKVKASQYESIYYKITLNSVRTKFLVGVSHKHNDESKYKTDFLLYDIKNNMKAVWKKTLSKNFFHVEMRYGMNMFDTSDGFWNGANVIFLGMMVDEEDNLFYSSYEKDKNTQGKELRFNLLVGIFDAKKNIPNEVELKFDEKYQVSDIEFSKTVNNEILVAGFLKDVVEKKGEDLVNVGIFSYKIDLLKNEVSTKVVKIFSRTLLTYLESNLKSADYIKYKLDYIILAGEDTYYIGEQYKEKFDTTSNRDGFKFTYWEYNYRDVIVAKLNSKGEFEWITNAPMRNIVRLRDSQLYKQYIAVTIGNNLYIMRNDQPQNLKYYNERSYDPLNIGPMITIKGSSFLYSKISLSTGSIENDLIFENKDYCFAPMHERNPEFMPPSECEIFVPSSDSEIILYTQYKSSDKFVKLRLK